MCSPTDTMIGQVVGNVVARSGRPNDNCLLSDVLFPSRVFKGVDDLPFELFLQSIWIENQLKEEEIKGSGDLLRESRNDARSTSESSGKDEVSRTEDPFELFPV